MDNFNGITVRVLSAICDSIATPIGERQKRLAIAGEWTSLQKASVSPFDYVEAEAYWKDNLVCELVRKLDVPTDVDKRGVAVETFFKTERQCCVTNARLHRYQHDSLLLDEPHDNDVHRFITEWRKNVSFVFGNFPTDLTPLFSGGATYDDIGRLINLPDKMSSVPTIYDETRCLLPLWYETSWARVTNNGTYRQEPKTVLSNRFSTVPKDAVKHRGICVEASIPLGYQLAVGRLLKRRIKDNAGVDLSSADKRHRLLAKEASVTGQLATIDMSNASDTVSYGLVRLLVPHQWFSLLTSLRASKTLIDGQLVNLEKFSSMGNGFTFELETILFMTLARTVVALAGGDPTIVSCFGDDLIVPTEYSSDIKIALTFFGFEVNKKKSFDEGLFRESCGGDYFNGIPVRAYYLKLLPDEPQQTIAFMNGLRKACVIDGALASCRWIHVVKAWHILYRSLPKEIARCLGPSHLGDIVIHNEDSETWQTRRLPASLGGVIHGSPIQVRCYRPVIPKINWKYWLPEVQLACCTLGVESDGITPRTLTGDRTSYRLAWVISDRQSDFLPIPVRGAGNYNTLFS